ncbi:MAG: ABC transporter ATP-binding protein [Velocimicrobium sp.]
MNALEFRNVSKRYDDFTLDHLNLTIPSGCIVGFIGENGAGKTTTMKLIFDLVKADTGEIKVFGKSNKTDSREIKEHIGVVLEEAGYPDSMNLKQIESVVSRIYKTWNSKRFLELCSMLSLPQKKEIKDFSRGMKMKLSLCVALSHDSKLLILDEATSGLDPIVRDELLDIFLEFIQTEDHTIFISSHILSDLEKICDYIAFIHKGKLLFFEEKDALLEKYGILKTSKEEIASISTAAIIGTRENSFGVESLINKNKYTGNKPIDKATIEDIMLYYTKGAKTC